MVILVILISEINWFTKIILKKLRKCKLLLFFLVYVLMIWWGKVCIALYFCGEKYALLHEYVGQICPANAWSLHTLVPTFMEQCILYPAKLLTNAHFAPQNLWCIVSGEIMTTNIFSKILFSHKNKYNHSYFRTL